MAFRWLQEVQTQRPLALRLHLMTLYLVNAGRADLDEDHWQIVLTPRGPARVAMAALHHSGQVGLRAFYEGFGRRNWPQFHWARPEQLHGYAREALAEAGLPRELEDVMDTEECDEALRVSHQAGVQALGGLVGTPTTHVQGRAFFGPVLNAIPYGAAASEIFEGARLLAAHPDFYELKRPRTSPPVFT
jgi:hypothetical protein